MGVAADPWGARVRCKIGALEREDTAITGDLHDLPLAKQDRRCIGGERELGVGEKRREEREGFAYGKPPRLLVRYERPAGSLRERRDRLLAAGEVATAQSGVGAPVDHAGRDAFIGDVLLARIPPTRDEPFELPRREGGEAVLLGDIAPYLTEQVVLDPRRPPLQRDIVTRGGCGSEDGSARRDATAMDLRNRLSAGVRGRSELHREAERNGDEGGEDPTRGESGAHGSEASR
ncbi:MAG: hypothetical protein CMN29_20465 [Sandaracinus sp.]|nr:hypothetical protein [Sandaracinus sp.]